jgi:hypothetical protein
MDNNIELNKNKHFVNTFLLDNKISIPIFNKTLVLYAFHEDNYNVQFFIKNGIFKSSNVDFILICNNETLKVECPNYVKYINRKNIGYDFGGWSEGLLTNDLYKNYYNFIFANSSVVGPITTKYYKDEWINIYLDGLKDNVKLYGSMINMCGFAKSCEPINDTHLQSYAFCMNIDTLNFLIGKEIFSMTNMISKYEDVVINKEIRMSREILNNNWNIGCIFHHYNNIDFTNKNIYSNHNIFNDNFNTLRYHDELIHPYELIFIKEKYVTNKNWINTFINKYTDTYDHNILYDIIGIVLIIIFISYYISINNK